jgi:predicted HTH domain antitoxin
METNYWEIEAFHNLSSVRPGIITDALKELWKIRPELYKMVVIGAYLDERISLTKAAENLGITRMEFEKDLRESGIPVRSLSKEDVIAEVEILSREDAIAEIDEWETEWRTLAQKVGHAWKGEKNAEKVISEMRR